MTQVVGWRIAAFGLANTSTPARRPGPAAPALPDQLPDAVPDRLRRARMVSWWQSDPSTSPTASRIAPRQAAARAECAGCCATLRFGAS